MGKKEKKFVTKDPSELAKLMEEKGFEVSGKKPEAAIGNQNNSISAVEKNKKPLEGILIQGGAPDREEAERMEIEGRVEKLEKDFEELDNKIGKLEDDMVEYEGRIEGGDDVKKGFYKIKEAKEEEIARAKELGDVELVNKVFEELKLRHADEINSFKSRLKKLENDFNSIKNDFEAIGIANPDKVKNLEGKITELSGDLVLLGDNIDSLNNAIAEELESLEKKTLGDGVFLKKKEDVEKDGKQEQITTVAQTGKNKLGKADELESLRKELAAANRKIREAQSHKNKKMEDYYKAEKEQVVKKIKEEEEKNKKTRTVKKPVAEKAGPDKVVKDELVGLLNIIYKQKQEAIAKGKASRSFWKLSFPKFAKNNKEKFDKLAQGQGDEIRNLIDQYNKELEKAFNEKQAKLEEDGGKKLGEYSKYIDKKYQKESLRCLGEIMAAEKKILGLAESVSDKEKNAEIRKFINEYAKANGFKKKDLHEYGNQKRFLGLTKILLAQVENKIKSFDKKHIKQEASDIVLEHNNETLESESVNEERVGAQAEVSSDQEDFQESHDVSESTPDPEGEFLTDKDIELQILRRKREEIEKEIGGGMVGMRITELHNKLSDINKQIESLEKGEVIGEISAEDKQQFTKEVEQMPAKEREKIGFGLRNMGFFAREWKSRKLAELCEFAAGKKKNKFLSALAETYRKDEGNARKQIEDSDKIKGLQQLQNAGYITGGALKWGRTVADIAGWTAGSPLRYVTLGAQFFSRGAEAAKEARFKNEEVMDKTRIKDIDEAADEAWRLYGQAKAKVEQDGAVSGELLNKVYTENLPADLLKRLQSTEPGTATGILQSILKKDIEWAIKKGKITKNSFELFLKDCDRLVGHYGEIDTLALGARYAQTAGKAVVAGVAVETLALLIQRAPEIVQNAGSILHRLDQIWEGEEPRELPKGPQPSEMQIPQPERAPDVFGAKEGVEQALGYQGGKSIWQEAEKQLEARFNLRADNSSMEVLKTLNVDKIKDAIVENPVKYGLDESDNLDRLSVDKLQDIKWDLVFSDMKADNAFVSELDSARGESILKNNETLRTFFAEHPDAPRTSENYENILQGGGETGEETVEKIVGVKELKGQVEFENQYGLKIEAVGDKMQIMDAKGRVLDVIPIEEGIEAEENIKNAKIEALHIINWSKADFESIVGKADFEIADGKQAVFKGVIPGSGRISIDDAERAGINVFGKVGLSTSDKVKLNAWMENIKLLDNPEKAKLFFDLSDKTGIKLSSSEFKSAFSKLPEGFTADQKVGYIKIFAGGNIQEGVNDLLDIKGSHAKEVVAKDNIIEIKDLVYKGKRMDIFISKDGKIGVDGEGIRLGVEKKWLGLGRTMPMMEVDEKNIGLIQNRIGAREELILEKEAVKPEIAQNQNGSGSKVFEAAAAGRLEENVIPNGNKDGIVPAESLEPAGDAKAKIDLEKIIASKEPLMYEFKEAKIDYLNFKFGDNGEIKSVIVGSKPGELLDVDALKTEKWNEEYLNLSPINKTRFNNMAIHMTKLHEGYRELLANNENELAGKLLKYMQKQVKISKGMLEIPE